MKVTIYTISDEESSYCKDAKDFLTAHNIQFEEKDVEHDRQALSEMQRDAQDFAGVPVIVIDDNGQKKVVKGFTPQELEQALGLPSQPEAAIPASQVPETPAVAPVIPSVPEPMDQNTNQMDQSVSVPSPTADSSVGTQPATSEPLVVPTPSPVIESTPAPMPEAVPVQNEEHDDQLKGIMDTLSSSAAAPAMPTETPVEPAVPNPIPETPLSAEPVVPQVPEAPVVAQPASEVPAPSSAEATAVAQPAADSAALPSIPDFPQK